MDNSGLTDNTDQKKNWLATRGVVVSLIVILLVLLAAGLFSLQQSVANNEAVANAKLRRLESLRLVDHLRQTSDDLTRMARSFAATGEPRFEEYFERRVDPRQRTYYWQGADRQSFEASSEVDGTALEENFISITPIKCDTTDYETLYGLRDWNLTVPGGGRAGPGGDAADEDRGRK